MHDSEFQEAHTGLHKKSSYEGSVTVVNLHLTAGQSSKQVSCFQIPPAALNTALEVPTS